MTAQQDIRPTGWSPTGLLAGRYELDGLLGSGGTAEVFRGRDRRLGRPVAVKVFRSGVDPELGDHFEDEALLLARLEHAGLVTVYDIGRHEGRSFLVMQLVEGRTLRQCAAGAAMDPHRVAEIGAGLADTLAHVHAAGIMHCDVKPSNILLDGAGRPYLTDFGISRPVDTTATVPGDGALVGTAAYMAPEQVRGERVEQPADIYALGLVLLQCITGRLEYPGAPMESAVERLHRAPEIPSALPPQLALLLEEMTSSRPEERPDARECAERLGELLETVRPGEFLLAGAVAGADGSDAPLDSVSPAVGTSVTRSEERAVAPVGRMRRRGGGALAAAGAAVAMTVLGVTLSGADFAGGSGSPTVQEEAPTGEASTQPSSSAEAPGTPRAESSGPASRPPSGEQKVRSVVQDGGKGRKAGPKHRPAAVKEKPAQHKAGKYRAGKGKAAKAGKSGKGQDGAPDGGPGGGPGGGPPGKA